MENSITPHTSLISVIFLQIKGLKDNTLLSAEYYIKEVNKRIDLVDLIYKNANKQLSANNSKIAQSLNSMYKLAEDIGIVPVNIEPNFQTIFHSSGKGAYEDVPKNEYFPTEGVKTKSEKSAIKLSILVNQMKSFIDKSGGIENMTEEYKNMFIDRLENSIVYTKDILKDTAEFTKQIEEKRNESKNLIVISNSRNYYTISKFNLITEQLESANIYSSFTKMCNNLNKVIEDGSIITFDNENDVLQKFLIDNYKNKLLINNKDERIGLRKLLKDHVFDECVFSSLNNASKINNRAVENIKLIKNI